MKRSDRIVLRLLPVLSAAALAAGCGSRGQQAQGWQTCVDQGGRVAEEQACVEERRASHPAGYFPMYRWYYYPYGGSPYPLGYGVPAGGSYATDPYRGVPTRSMGTPATGGAAPRAGSVRYGGFGSTASGAVGE